MREILTRECRLTGTIREQWEGVADLDRRTDVWGLGVVLYELLSGQLPFHRAGLNSSDADFRQLVFDESPIPLRVHVKKIPRAIERVCMRCLEKDRVQRYQSAAELAANLQSSIQKRASWW